MPRNVSSQALSEAAAGHSTSAHLLELTFDPGTGNEQLYINTSAQDVVTSGLAGVPNETWFPIGLPGGQSPLGIGPVSETAELRAQEVEIVLDGVDQTAIGAIQNNFFRGRTVRLWKVWFGSNGQISAHALMFVGYQNDNWEITETNERDEKTVRVSTRLVSRMAVLSRINPVMTNVDSHNQMLRRAGISGVDQGFSTTPRLRSVTISWGTTEAKDYPRPRGWGA